MSPQLITQEDFTSVQEAQAGITRLFKKAAQNGKFYRVMRNQTPLGVLIPNALWDSFLEDLEALYSTTLKQRIQTSRQNKTRYTATQVKRLLRL